jgi:NAD(P)-dependent dehydrogenase (short-subunit alcohol dehydrogenase family)
MRESHTNPFSLCGKTIVVTGGTRGIGQAISLRLARAGATVIANYLRHEVTAKEVESIAMDEGLALSTCRADVTQERGLDQLKYMVQASSTHLCGLVHCAATGSHRPIHELTVRHFDWTFNLNVRSFFMLSRAFWDRFAEGCSIVAVSSWGATRAFPCYSLIGSSKGALEAFARHLAIELAPRGVRVNILRAGAVLTDTWTAIPNCETRLADTVHRTPIGRLVNAEEVAYGAQFLCSDAAAGIVGQTLIIDGGIGVLP